MEFLLPTDEKRTTFINNAIGYEGKEINKMLMDIRRNKIKQRNIDLNQFVAECQQSEKAAVESLLQEHINDAKYDKLKRTGVSPSKLFHIHRMNPFAKTMNIISFA